MSIFISPMGPISEYWFFKDYWHPETFHNLPIFILDLFFSFCLGGVSFGIYKLVFNKKIEKSINYRKRYYLAFLCLAVTMGFLLIGTNYLGINSILTSSFAFVSIAVYIFSVRKDLLIPSLISSILTLVVFAFIYTTLSNFFSGTFEKWCINCNPSGVRILGINIEELIWDASWGLVGGVIYEAITGRIIKDRGAINA